MPEANGFERQPDMDAVVLANAPTINLGGKVFHIPRLAIVQNKVVVGCMKAMLPMMGTLEAIAKAEKTEPGSGAAFMMRNFPLDDASFDSISKAVYAACTRGYVISQAQFDLLAVGIDELMTAVVVVVQQSFAFAKKLDRGGVPAASPGEAEPGPILVPPPSGTESP